MTKAGSGTLVLLGGDTYTGATVVSAGALNIQNNAALADTSSVTVDSGATLQLQGGITTSTAVALNLSGTGLSNNGALESVTGVNTYSGLVTLGAAASIGADAGSTLNLTNAGTITGAGFGLTLTGAGNGNLTSIIGTGAGGLTMSGSGVWTLTGANTFTGATTISAGTLALGAGGSIADSSGVNLAGGSAIFDISAAGNQTIGDLAGVAGSVVNLGANTLTAGTANSTAFAGALEGTGGGFTKVGAGTLTLSGANTYTGATTINGGAISVAAVSTNLADTSGIVLGGGELITTTTSATNDTVTLNTGNDTLAAAVTTTATYGGVIGNGTGGALTSVIPPILGPSFSPPPTTIRARRRSTTARCKLAMGRQGRLPTPARSRWRRVRRWRLTRRLARLNPTRLPTAARWLVARPPVHQHAFRPINGGGAFTQTGAGTTVLSGTNGYTGTTTVTTGTLQIGNGTTGSIANASAVSVSGGATLAIDEVTGSTQSNTITDNGTVVGIEGAGVTNTLSGPINGSGVFTQAGTGTTILSRREHVRRRHDGHGGHVANRQRHDGIDQQRQRGFGFGRGDLRLTRRPARPSPTRLPIVVR